MTRITEAAAKVYAHALFQVGSEQECLGEIYDDLHVVLEAFAGQDDIRAVFGSPKLSREDRWKALRAALEGRVCKPVLGLVHVLTSKGRGALFDNVVQQFDKFKDENENRMHALLTVATPMDEAFRAGLIKRLSEASGKNVELHEHVDPTVIGGAALRVGDRVIDRTIKHRLAALRKHLLGATRTA